MDAALYRAVGLFALLAFVAIVLVALGSAFLNIGSELRQAIDTIRDISQAVR